jgi:release factor glutamine methyltransferase
MTVGGALRTAARQLRATSESAAADAAILLAHALRCDRARLTALRDDELPPEARERFSRAVAERSRGVPVAYLIGSAGFYGREFEVNGDVLVPRPETEHLVEAALSELRSRPAAARRVCDVGTGSGAIAVTLACESPGAAVVASDVSAAALETARRNARRHGVAARVRFVQGDLADPLRALAPFDVVVANLPYVPAADVPPAPLPVSFEPRIAVDGGPDGLALYRSLIAQIPAIAAPGAMLCFEAAPPTIDALAALVEQALPGSYLEIGQDYAGLDRYVSATLPVAPLPGNTSSLV